MGFEPRDRATAVKPREGDTLESIAEREAAQGNPLTAGDLALFNFGSSDPERVQERLRDQLGARKRDAANRFVLSPSDDAESPLLIPKVLQSDGLATGQRHVLRVLRSTLSSQFVGCAQIAGITFDFDSSFVRPEAREGLDELARALARNPEAKLFVFGHTDKVGSEEHNKGLSDRRAEAVFGVVRKDPEIWERISRQEKWGTKETQRMLAALGGEFDPGRPDGIRGAKTEDAIRRFQSANGLSADGVVGAGTRRALFRAYMDQLTALELAEDRFALPSFVGCGEFNPQVETEGRNEANRRVALFLFHPDRLPRFPCKVRDLAPCRKQINPPLPRFTESFRCSFFDSISRQCHHERILDVFRIRLFDNEANFLVGAPFVVQTSQGEIPGVTDGDGDAVVHDLVVPTKVLVRWSRPPGSVPETAPRQGVTPAGGFEFEIEVFADIDDEAPVDSAQPGQANREAVRQRLHNLGYRFGPTLEDNVRDFQADLGLPAEQQSGNPDDVAALLVEHHDQRRSPPKGKGAPGPGPTEPAS